MDPKEAMEVLGRNANTEQDRAVLAVLSHLFNGAKAPKSEPKSEQKTDDKK